MHARFQRLSSRRVECKVSTVPVSIRALPRSSTPENAPIIPYSAADLHASSNSASLLQPCKSVAEFLILLFRTAFARLCTALHGFAQLCTAFHSVKFKQSIRLNLQIMPHPSFNHFVTSPDSRILRGQAPLVYARHPSPSRHTPSHSARRGKRAARIPVFSFSGLLSNCLVEVESRSRIPHLARILSKFSHLRCA